MIIGYRGWRVDKVGQLWPLAMDKDPWIPGPNKAVHLTPFPPYVFSIGTCETPTPFWFTKKHTAPDSECGEDCGLWILKLLNTVLSATYIYPRCNVFGVVRGWGKIIGGDTGWRTEYAQIEAIAPLSSTFDGTSWVERKVHLAAMRYDVFYAPDILALERIREALPS